jgi:hypothetical protein
MKLKILIIIGLTFINLSYTLPVNANQTNEEFQACLATCIENVCPGNECSAELRFSCQNQCRAGSNQEFLPPILKPTLLPGPTFEENTKRTGLEVNQYITEKVFPRIAARLITVIAVISMLAIVYAGIQFFTAMGDTEKAAAGKKTAIFAVIGLVIALLSFTIVQIVTLLPFNTQ